MRRTRNRTIGLSLLALGGGLIWLGLRRSSSGTALTYSGTSTATIDRDATHLLPAFAARLELVFDRLRARGFDPILWEGCRSQARAAELAKQGVGIVRSMHTVCAAADVVSKKDLWSNQHGFYDAFGEEVERAGLTWGGRWTGADNDPDHVQAVPVTLQAKLLAATTPTARNAIVAQALA